MKKIISIIVALAVVAIAGIGVGYYFSHRNSAQQAANTSTGTISESEAQTAALEDAKLTEDDVQFTKVHLDRDDGRQQYELEFIASADNTKYDYEIDAATGAILSSDKEQGRSTANANNNTAAPQSGNEITADEAKSIAFEHAGVAEADALYMDVSYDNDDGRTEWSVSFSTQDTEYDYEIAAADGSILSSEKEATHR